MYMYMCMCMEYMYMCVDYMYMYMYRLSVNYTCTLYNIIIIITKQNFISLKRYIGISYDSVPSCM